VQNRQTDETLLPLFCLTSEQPPATDDVRSAIAYDRHVEAFNSRSSRRPLYISTTAPSPLDEQGAQPLVDSLTAVLHADSTSMIALWQRAVCHWRLARYQTSLGGNASLQMSLALADLNRALAVDPQDALLYYNRATLYAERRDYRQAISDYDRALRIEPNLAEAWYNRGLCHIFADNKAAGVSDLSKAGEMGLYTAYNLIKRYR
jgi:tetratricopeptide (TPR) repeat protein